MLINMLFINKPYQNTENNVHRSPKMHPAESCFRFYWNVIENITILRSYRFSSFHV